MNPIVVDKQNIDRKPGVLIFATIRNLNVEVKPILVIGGYLFHFRSIRSRFDFNQIFDAWKEVGAVKASDGRANNDVRNEGGQMTSVLDGDLHIVSNSPCGIWCFDHVCIFSGLEEWSRKFILES